MPDDDLVRDPWGPTGDGKGIQNVKNKKQRCLRMEYVRRTLKMFAFASHHVLARKLGSKLTPTLYPVLLT